MFYWLFTYFAKICRSNLPVFIIYFVYVVPYWGRTLCFLFQLINSTIDIFFYFFQKISFFLASQTPFVLIWTASRRGFRIIFIRSRCCEQNSIFQIKSEWKMLSWLDNTVWNCLSSCGCSISRQAYWHFNQIRWHISIWSWRWVIEWFFWVIEWIKYDLLIKLYRMQNFHRLNFRKSRMMNQIPILNHQQWNFPRQTNNIDSNYQSLQPSLVNCFWR